MKASAADQKADFFEKTKSIVEKTENKIINFKMLNGWIYYICNVLVSTKSDTSA